LDFLQNFVKSPFLWTGILKQVYQTFIMASIGSISIELKLDRTQFDGELGKLQGQRIEPIKVKVDTEDINRQIKALRIDCIPVKICIEKEEALATIRQVTDSVPRQIYSELILDTTKATQQISLIKASLNTVVADFNIDLERSVSRIKVEPSKSQTTEKTVSEQLKTTEKAVNEQIKRVEKAVRDGNKGESIFSKLANSAIFGIGQNVGNRFAQGSQTALKSAFGLDIEKLGENATGAAIKPLKLVLNNEELKQSLGEVSELLATRLRKTAYAFGDGIVAALENTEGDIVSKFNSFTKALTNDVDFNKLGEELTAEFEEAKQKIQGSIFTEGFFRELFAPMGEAIAEYREVAIQERALPLVRQRALEISKATKGKSDQLATKAVSENTENLFIAVGGYAGARGLSGRTLVSGFQRGAPGLNADLKDDSGKNAVIWVKNEDSDIPREALGDAPKKLMALLTSLGKPNLRGYSNDAVEISAQALAAKEKNPEINIKILGESGGGFAAEEAHQILKLLGIESEYLAVGTPDFIGSPNKINNKILSPDESLGAETAGRYARIGLANRTKGQNILGVSGHPYENYRNAEIAELMNFLKGSPGQATPEVMGEFRQGISFFQNKSKDKKSLGKNELNQLYESAFKNLQQIRRFLLVATDDTKEELEAIVDQFQEIVIDLAPEDRNLSELTSAIEKSREYLEYLRKQPGIEAGLVANQIADELASVEKQLSKSGKNLVGTPKAQYDAALKDAQKVRQELLDPKIGVKGSKFENENFQTQYKIKVSDITNSANIQQIEDFKSALSHFQEQNKDNLGVEQISQLVQAAVKNIEFLQDELQKASEETKSDLEKIIQGFGEIVVDFTPENADLINGLISRANSTQSKTQSAQIQEIQALAVARASEITTSFNQNFQSIQNQISAATDTGDFTGVSEFAKTFAGFVANARKELEVMKSQLQEIGALSPEAATAIDSKAKSTITKTLNKADRELKKAGINDIDLIKEAEQQAASIGSNITTALSEAIAANAHQPQGAIAEVANLVIESAEERLEIKSPSRVFQRIGRFVVEGFNQGVAKIKAISPLREVESEAKKDGFNLMSIFTKVKNVIGGILAFQVSNYLRNFFSDLARTTFQAYVELKRYKTALNFAAGSRLGGSRSLAFIREQADQYGNSLRSSIQGFTQLEGAARGTALAGRGTKELFTGISQAGTVLNLTSEQLEGVNLAITQILSKNRLYGQEVLQLTERIPGIRGILARSQGVSDQEFTRLAESGQILAEDILPKLGKQLRSEFGDAAKDAAGNAQSAINKLENSILTLQQNVGEGVAPAATIGMNLLTESIKMASKFAKEFGIAIASVTLALTGKMLVALGEVANQFIKLNFAGGTLQGGLQSLFTTINNSNTAKAALGFFALGEIINLINQQINTEFIKSFEDLASSAQRSADKVDAAFEKIRRKKRGDNQPQKEDKFEPEATSEVGRNVDNFLIKPLKNPYGVGVLGSFIPGLGPAADLARQGGFIKTTGEYEREEARRNFNNQISAIDKLAKASNLGFLELQKGVSGNQEFVNVDKKLQELEQARQILQSQIKRDFTDKGVQIPVDLKLNLVQLNTQINTLTDQRAELIKPFTDAQVEIDKKIAELKTTKESLELPDALRLSSDAELAKDKAAIDQRLEMLERLKSGIEKTISAFRIDPVKVFSQTVREINLELAKGQEKSDFNFKEQRVELLKNQSDGFSKNPYLSRDINLTSATNEYRKSANDLDRLEKQVIRGQKAVAAPNFQNTLRRLGVSQDSGVAEIQSIIERTQDEADKNILEQLKSLAQNRLQIPDARATFFDAENKFRQTRQENRLFNIDNNLAKSRAVITQNENLRVAGYKRSQLNGDITPELADEGISRLQLGNVLKQKEALDTQLTQLKNYHKTGEISAEEFTRRERDLTTEQTALERQEAEVRLSIRQMLTQRKLRLIENEQTREASRLKENFLNEGMNSEAQEKLNITQVNNDIKFAQKRLETLRREKAAKSEIAQVESQLIDARIKREQELRNVAEARINRTIQLETEKRKLISSALDEQKNKIDLYNQKLDLTTKLEESRFNLNKAQADAGISSLDIRKSNADRALELSRRLQGEDVPSQLKNIINSQLGILGFGNNELSILQQRVTIEDEIANKKLESLKLEQKYQRENLANDLKRQKLAEIGKIYDAQGLQLSAAKNKLDSEGALRIAQIKKDDIGIQSAKIGLQLADKEIKLADNKLAIAIEALKAQQELSSNAILAQEATQRSALDQQIAADQARKQANALELVEASVKKISNATKDTNKTETGSNPANVEGWENPFKLKEGESSWDYNKRIMDAKITGQIQETRRNTTVIDQSNHAGISPSASADQPNYNYDPVINAYWESVNRPKQIEFGTIPKLDMKSGENMFEAYMRSRGDSPLSPKPRENIFEAYMRQQEESRKLANEGKIKPNEPNTDLFAQSLKAANQDVVKKLDEILAAYQSNKMPTNLTVTTPDPVDDAAKILNDLAKMQVLDAGI
jgi:tape measure domain-containing protein